MSYLPCDSDSKAVAVAAGGCHSCSRVLPNLQGIKELSEWPTFPQLFVRGELLGGCDIVETLAAEGSLASSIDDMLQD